MLHLLREHRSCQDVAQGQAMMNHSIRTYIGQHARSCMLVYLSICLLYLSLLAILLDGQNLIILRDLASLHPFHNLQLLSSEFPFLPSHASSGAIRTARAPMFGTRSGWMCLCRRRRSLSIAI